MRILLLLFLLLGFAFLFRHALALPLLDLFLQSTLSLGCPIGGSLLLCHLLADLAVSAAESSRIVVDPYASATVEHLFFKRHSVFSNRGCGELICITMIDSQVENGLVPSSGRGGSLDNRKESISCTLPFVDAAAIADRRGKHSRARVRQCFSIVISF